MTGTLLKNCSGCGVVFEQPRRQGRPWSKCDSCAGRAPADAVTVGPARVAAGYPGDPQVRADGGCARCGTQRHPERSKRYAGVQAELDPFCSSPCAKSHYGVTFGLTVDDEDDELVTRRTRGGEMAAQQFRDRHPNTAEGAFAR